MPFGESPVRTFNKSCDAIWPAALQVAKDNGWKIDAATPGKPIRSGTGTIRFAVGDKDCDVYARSADADTERKILADIAARMTRPR